MLSFLAPSVVSLGVKVVTSASGCIFDPHTAIHVRYMMVPLYRLIASCLSQKSL